MPEDQFWCNSSGQFTFAMFQVPAACYPDVCAALAEAFGLASCTPLVDGWDVLFQDYRHGEKVVGLEWDHWCGFIVVAKNPGSEDLVRDIAAWLLHSEWAETSST